MTKHEVYDGYHQVETIVDCLTQKADVFTLLELYSTMCAE